MLQTTLLALLGCAAGLGLHLRWHPCRRAFSDAWDFVRLRQPLVLVFAALLMAGGMGERFSGVELEDWRALWLPLLQRACTDTALQFHTLMPPWPLALALPLALLVLTIRVWRWPYRYGERVPVPEQKLVLVGLTLLGTCWVLLESVSWQRGMLPEVIETLRSALRAIFTALTAASVQVWLARLVVAYEKPPDTEAERDAVAAVESSFARWQSVVALGGFNLLWMSWRTWRAVESGPSAWLLSEWLLLCAPLPLAVAVSGGGARFGNAGALALRLLWRGLPALVSFLPTAVAMHALVRYASDMAMHYAGTTGITIYIVQVFVALAMSLAQIWLGISGLLLLLRHGFPKIAA